MPSAPLQPISLHVEEPDDGVYVWVLAQRTRGPRWVEVDRATAGSGTYHEAMARGLVALQSLVPDLDRGPREALPARPHASESPAPHPAEPSKASAGYFGFGPVR